jgi:hypothetical protein
VKTNLFCVKSQNICEESRNRAIDYAFTRLGAKKIYDTNNIIFIDKNEWFVKVIRSRINISVNTEQKINYRNRKYDFGFSFPTTTFPVLTPVLHCICFYSVRIDPILDSIIIILNLFSEFRKTKLYFSALFITDLKLRTKLM